MIETGLGLRAVGEILSWIVGWSSAVLLCSFALTMSIALGILAPLGYGVFTAVGAALLLGAIGAPRTSGEAEPAKDTRSRTRLSGLTDVFKV